MYFGSVKFFRHLIYMILATLILLPTILAIVFATKYNQHLKNPVETDNPQKTTQDMSSISDAINLDNICKTIITNKFTTKEIIDSFKKNNIVAMDEIFKEHYTNTAEELEYKTKFPDLYVTAPSGYTVTDNTIYLTFDDGPSENTISILNILDKYNIKATFFVSGDKTERSKEILKEIIARGHTVGMHSISHDLPNIYESADTFLDDFNNTYNYIYNATGIKPSIFRFAGGSINDYDSLIYNQIIAEILRRGFVYYDWNVSGEDASKDATWTSIYNNVLNSLGTKSRAVILLHDSKDKYTTVTVVEDLIIAIQKKGYKFDRLTPEVKPITFGYID